MSREHIDPSLQLRFKTLVKRSAVRTNKGRLPNGGGAAREQTSTNTHHHFSARPHICLARYMLSSVLLSVCLSVCHTGRSVKNG